MLLNISQFYTEINLGTPEESATKQFVHVESSLASELWTKSMHDNVLMDYLGLNYMIPVTASNQDVSI